jgi:hypothetical protein
VLGKALDGAVRLFNRNPWTLQRLQLVERENVPFYAEDGLWTYHAHAFVEDERFVSAYRRAMRASGADYGIRKKRLCGTSGHYSHQGLHRSSMTTGFLVTARNARRIGWPASSAFRSSRLQRAKAWFSARRWLREHLAGPGA